MLACVAVVALYGLIGAFVLPPLAKKIAADRLGEKLGRVVVIDDIAINPFKLTASVNGMRAFEADGRTPFAAFDTLAVDASIVSLRHLAPVIDSLTLSGLRVSIVRDRDNHYNFSDILERLARDAQANAARGKQKDKPEQKQKFSFSNIRITGAQLDIDDQPKRARHQVSEINLSVPFISNLPTHLKEFVQPAFSAKVNGAQFQLAGETKPFENSLETHLNLDIDTVDVRKYLEYSPVALPVRVDSTLAGAKLKLVFTQTQSNDSTVHITGRASLRDIRISPAAPSADGPLASLAGLDVDIKLIDPIAQTFDLTSVRAHGISAGKELLRTPALEARGVTLDLLHRRLVVAEVLSEQGTVALKRARDGSFELPSLGSRVQPSADASAPAAVAADAETPSGGAGEWIVLVNKFSLAGYNVSVLDATVTPALTHRVAITNLAAENISSERGAKAAIQAQFGINRNGSLALTSTVSINPLVATAQIDARRLDLTPVRAYITQFPNVKLVSATVGAKGTLGVREQPNGMHITYTGAADVAQLAAIDTKSNEDLLKWEALKLADVAFESAPDAPLSLMVASVALDKFYSRLVLNADGKFNIQELKSEARITPESTPPPAPPPQGPSTAIKTAKLPASPAAETPPRNVRIDKIAFTNSRLDFSDFFIKPNYSADLGELEGTITGLSSQSEARAVIDLKGSYARTAPVVINGTINPLRGDLFLDIKANGRDIDLPALTAYSVKYAGYGITQGKLALDVSYHIENGKLDAQNKVMIAQLTFGEHVDGPDATKLPLLFAVSLLKNSKGEIELNLPVTGSLDDPQFGIGALIGKVVVNLLTKAVTSPFTLLAAIAGGGDGRAGSGAGGAGGAGEDLAYVEFEHGRSTLTPAAQAKLLTLVKALQERPALKLELAPRVDPEQDLAALKKAAFQRKVKAAKRDDLGGGKAADVDEIVVDPSEYAKYLTIAYGREKFSKPRNVIGIAKELPVPEMEALIQASINVGDEDLRNLALQRAERVKGFLLDKGHLPADRLQVATANTPSTESNTASPRGAVNAGANTDASPPDKAGPGSKLSRVEFALK